MSAFDKSESPRCSLESIQVDYNVPPATTQHSLSIMSQQFSYYLSLHVGHTRCKAGLFEMDRKERLPICRASCSFWNDEPFPPTTLLNWLSPESNRDEEPEWAADPRPSRSTTVAILTGSNPSLVAELRLLWDARLPERVIEISQAQIPVRALVDFPEKVGADRLLNAAAINRLRPAGSPSIIVDTGTAITVDAVSAQGDFLGGAILPGVLMGARALHEFTTTLPHLDGRKFLETAPSALGRNTEAAIASGLYWGHIGAVKELVFRLRREFSPDPIITLTGGAAPLLLSDFPDAIYQEHLTLLGTVLAAEYLLGII